MTKGRYGIHGGQYIPETLMNAVIELEEAYNHYKNDKEFNDELNTLLNEYAGRPSRLYYAKRMTEDLGGAKIYLKREDLNHTGAHKINNTIGQILLARRMGKTRIIAETVPDSMEWLRLRYVLDEYGMYRLYGEDRRGTPTCQRTEDGDAGSYRRARDLGKHDLERRHERGDP